MSIHAGTTLGGRYVLRSLLAVGGMGEVWRAEDTELGRPVAVKVLKEHAAANETFLKRFRNEARNAAGLIDDRIAQVFDYGDQEHTAYLVMELVEGEPLSTIIEREKTLPEARIATILAQTARGLDVAHRAHVMHRDVKPGNLIVREGDRVKITDFGVSRSHDQTTLTQTGMVMGTAQYLAPEMALGKPATPASDLYALGIIAYECVVGKRPFTAATAVDIAIAHVNEDVPPLPASVSPAMASLIMDLLEKNPRKRPHSGADLAARIESLSLSAEIPVAPPQEEPVRAAEPQRRMPPTIAPKAFRPRPDVPRER